MIAGSAIGILPFGLLGVCAVFRDIPNKPTCDRLGSVLVDVLWWHRQIAPYILAPGHNLFGEVPNGARITRILFSDVLKRGTEDFASTVVAGGASEFLLKDT